MFRQNFKLSLIVCLLALVFSGCSSQKESMIDVNGLAGTDKPNPVQDKYEVIKLSNGVVIYKNKGSSENKSQAKPSGGLKFGPDDVPFELDKVNSKENL